MSESAIEKVDERTDLGTFMDRHGGGERYYNLSKDGVFLSSSLGVIDFEALSKDGAFFNPSTGDAESRSYLWTLFEKSKES